MSTAFSWNATIPIPAPPSVIPVTRKPITPTVLLSPVFTTSATPDIILVFGGTNDSWAGAPIGVYQYDGWTKADLYSFRPAFCYLLASLKQLYPAARIYNITNSELSEEVTDSMDEICRHYGIENIRLHDIDKQWGHPSVQGMQSIDAQVWESVSPILEASVSLPAKN